MTNSSTPSTRSPSPAVRPYDVPSSGNYQLLKYAMEFTPVAIVLSDVKLLKIALSLVVFDPNCDDATWVNRLAPMAKEVQHRPNWGVALKWLAMHWSSGALRGEPARTWATPDAVSGRTREDTFVVVWNRLMTNCFDNDDLGLQALFSEADEIEKGLGPMLPTVHLEEPHWKPKTVSQSASRWLY